jgi:predicted AlkP superfamily pyrophosphatase or phosphodiesterase
MSVDGLRVDALSAIRPPNIMALAARGAATFGAVTVSPAETLPAHASMITGVDPAVHGITWGDYQPQRGLIRTPTIFSAARAAGRTTALISGKNGFRHYLLADSVGYFADLDGGCAAVAGNASAMAARTDLVMVHFADVDLAGHRSGWMTPAYFDALRQVDASVGEMVAAAGPDATVILTADHGGRGSDHMGRSAEVMTIPWMIAGPRVGPGRALGPVDVRDTAATVLHVLGVPAPPGMGGRVVAEAFAR